MVPINFFHFNKMLEKHINMLVSLLVHLAGTIVILEEDNKMPFGRNAVEH
jgi:hypothetical protein